MDRRNPGAFWVYLGIAAIGLVGTAWFNVQSVVNPSGDTFLAAWFANPSVSSLSWDLLATASINLGLGNDRAQSGQVFRSERSMDFEGQPAVTGIVPGDETDFIPLPDK